MQLSSARLRLSLDWRQARTAPGQPRSVISVLRARARNRKASPRSHPRGSRACALDYGYSRAVRRTRPSPRAGRPRTARTSRRYLCSGHRMDRGAVAAAAAAVALGFGRKHERSDLLAAVVARSTHIQVYVQMHHDASANLAHRRLPLRVTERSSQPAESARCWLSSAAALMSRSGSLLQTLREQHWHGRASRPAVVCRSSLAGSECGAGV